jgi:ribosome-associated heat shock protein Hsp15
LNGERTDKPARAVGQGDVLTFAQGTQVRVVRILAPGTRRGPAPEAAGLYEDLAPPAQKPSGGERPTKKDRRAIDRARHGSSQ